MSQNEETSGNPAYRAAMAKFWSDHSTNANLEEMFLDKNAEAVDKAEAVELVPDVTGLDVLELASGIGRYTARFAEKARSVIAVDFTESFINKNKELNGHHSNASFIHEDVIQLQLPASSCDFVFGNFLLMYFEDEEVNVLLKKILTWLRPGGQFFCRDVCFHQSGDVLEAKNDSPAKCRHPGLISHLLMAASVETCSSSSGDSANFNDGEQKLSYQGSTYVFEMINSKSIQTYIKMKSRWTHVGWLLRKVCLEDVPMSRTFQEILDKKLYTDSIINCYEWIVGDNFVSNGGLETAQQFIKMLNLKKSETVLDLGCGIGGSAFYMAKTYDVLVTGMDLSANMIAKAIERIYEIKDIRVQFEVGDARQRNFENESFDAIYSRDTIRHIKDKLSLFKSCFLWMKPGGRLLVADYCGRADPESTSSPQFTSFVATRQYHLLSIDDYVQVLRDADFKSITVVDRTKQFVEKLQLELTKLSKAKQDFLKIGTEADYRDVTERWQTEIEHCASGDLKYASFYAEK